MPLELADAPRQIFERNPLRVVVAQIRFPPVFAIEHPAGIASFQELIRSDYPLAEQRTNEVSVVVGPGGMAPPIGQQGPWRFRSEDEQWIVALAPDFVGLECTNYIRFEHLQDRMERLLIGVQEIFQVSRCQRVGLRYINEFTHPEASAVADWARFLQQDLLGLAGGELLQDHVVQAVEQLHLSLDGGKMIINHGYVRPDDAGVYLLDLDAFDDRPFEFQVQETIDKLALFKQWVWKIFRRSITEEFAQYLGPKEMPHE